MATCYRCKQVIATHIIKFYNLNTSFFKDNVCMLRYNLRYFPTTNFYQLKLAIFRQLSEIPLHLIENQSLGDRYVLTYPQKNRILCKDKT